MAGGTPEAESLRHDWGQTLSDLIRENYLQPLTSFAETHHTKFRSQTYGEPAVTLADEATANLPEGEGPQWREFSFTRWASSASHLYDRNITSAETWTWLHSPAFRATPLDMKAEADRMFLSGVNQVVGHGYPYSPASAGEPGWCLYAAAALNSHNPWFPVMPQVTRYLQRISWLLRQGQPANDVAILLPEDDAQAAFTPGHVSVTEEMKKRISPELMSAILNAGYNIDYIDAATVTRLDRLPYPILVLPPMDRIPLAAYQKIKKYADSGGKVIAIGKAPSIAPGILSQADTPAIAVLSDQLFHRGASQAILINSISGLSSALQQALAPDMAGASAKSELGFIHRRLADADIYFVANTGNLPMEETVHFRSSYRRLELWQPDTGTVLSSASYCEGCTVSLQLASYESRVLVFSNASSAEVAELSKVSVHSVSVRQLAGLSRDWRVRFREREASHSLERTVKMKNLISWTELPGRRYYSGEVTYTHALQLGTLQKGRRLLLDFGSGTPLQDNRPAGAAGMSALLDPPIREAAIVEVNGVRAGSLWHPPYQIDISRFVHPGSNQIVVHVYNTAINEMAGQPPHDYTALEAKYGKRFQPQDMENLQPLRSGLQGPVRLLEESID